MYNEDFLKFLNDLTTKYFKTKAELELAQIEWQRWKEQCQVMAVLLDNIENRIYKNDLEAQFSDMLSEMDNLRKF